MAEAETIKRSSSDWKSFYNFVDKVKRFPGLIRRTTWKVGKEDPRRVVHSLKVGLSLTLVSLLYLMEPLFKGIGKNAMWAVMTVVVVMEFTVGMYNITLFSYNFSLTFIINIYICSDHIVIIYVMIITGATLSKGLNRGLGTLLAGLLAFLIEYVADVPTEIFRAILVGFAVFLLGNHFNFI